MENLRDINYWLVVRRDWRKLFFVTLAVVLLALSVTLIQPLLYRANVSILVLQRSSYSIDAYSAAKSEERTASKLSQVVYSSSFLTRVLMAGFAVNSNYFPSDERQRRMLWNKTIETDVPSGFSRLDISIYHPDPDQALIIAESVAQVLTAQKGDYISINDVDLKVLDTPLVTKYPVRPNIFLNIGIALLLGLLLGIVYIIASYNPLDDRLWHIYREPRKDNWDLKNKIKVRLPSLPLLSRTEKPVVQKLKVEEMKKVVPQVSDRKQSPSPAKPELPSLSVALSREEPSEKAPVVHKPAVVTTPDMNAVKVAPALINSAKMHDFVDEEQIFGPPGI